MKKRPNPFLKYLTLIKRDYKVTFREPKSFILYIVQLIMVSAFGCALYTSLNQDYTKDDTLQIQLIKNRIGSFFFLLMNLYINLLMNSSFKMGAENVIIYKEINDSHYSSVVYYLAKYFCDFTLLIVPSIMVIYPVSLNPESLQRGHYYSFKRFFSNFLKI